MDTLANVAGRARQIRRRRVALVGGGGALAVALVAVPLALALTGDDESGRLVPATVPEVPVTTADRRTDDDRGTDDDLDDQHRATGRWSPDVVAIRADGDAVRIGADGSETVLYDGADPRVQPEEGELTIVDSVAVTADGRTFVSTCCEPVPGSWFEVSAGAEPEFRAYGHGLDVSPDGQRILTVGAQFITVSDPDGGVIESVTLEGGDTYRQPNEAMWLPDGRIAVLELADGFRLYVAGSPSEATATTGVVIGTDIDAPWPSPRRCRRATGRCSCSRAPVTRPRRRTLQAYDPDTLERRADVALPDEATYARMQDGVLTWIGTDGSLHVGDAVVPGEYRWARPVS